jgi:hypothetical protein
MRPRAPGTPAFSVSMVSARIMAPVMIGNWRVRMRVFAPVVEASPMPEAFALLDAHASLWCELFDAAANGDRDAWRVLIETWRPLIGSIEVLPLAVGTLDDWNFEVAARSFLHAIEQRSSHEPATLAGA